MRVSLTLAAVLAWSRPAAGDEARAASWVSLYQSSDHVTVVSPQVSVSAPVHELIDVAAGYEADVISAASVDLVTAASPRGYHEVRQAVIAGTTWRPADATTIAIRWIPSWEPDYESQSFTLAAGREWIDRRLTTDLGARVAFDDVGRTGAARDTWRTVDTYGVTPSIAWVFGPRTVGHVAYEAQLVEGFQASPYRFVPIYGLAPGAPIGVAEADPDERIRHAIAAGVRHSFARGWYASISYRVYRDDWGVASHTEEIEVQRALLGNRLLLGLDARTYGQGAASFYQERYVAQGQGVPSLRTADKLLAPQWSVLAAARASYVFGALGPLRSLQLTGKIETYEERFFDFAPLTWRHATIASIGIAGMR